MAVNREDYTEQGVVVLAPTDELLTADAVQEIHDCIDSTAAKCVIIDFRTIHSLVSGSLYPQAEPFTPLIMLHKQMSQVARRLILCNLSSEIAEVFRLTRFDQMFEVQPDLGTALSDASGVSSQ